MDAGRCEDAIAAYENALSIRFDADTATDRGVCLRQLGRREQALATFEFLTLRKPSHWQARYNLTAMLLEFGRVDEARQASGHHPVARMTEDEAIVATKIHSVAGVLPFGSGLLLRRPFRAPHHTISTAGMAGGGNPQRPGR